MLIGMSAYAQLDHPLQVEITAPSSLAGSYTFGDASFGPTSIPTTIGQVQWAYDITPDSLACDSIPANGDLTGKFAMIRRGACTFTSKVKNAQVAGAIGCIICNATPGAGVITMGGADGSITIPSIMLSFEDCALIDAALANGDSVSMTFRKPFISEGLGYYAVETPQAQIYPHDSSMTVDITNASGSAANNVSVSLDIIEPNGNVVTLNETIALIGADSTQTVTFNSRYSPSDTGTYTCVFKQSLNSSDTIVKTFFIGTNRYRLDRETDYTWITVNDQSYADNLFKLRFGTSYITGQNGAVAKSVTYALGDNTAKFIGKPYVIELRAFPDVLSTAASASIDSFPIVAIAVDTITDADTLPYMLMTTNGLLDVNTLADSSILNPNSQYLVLIKYERPSSDTLPDAPRFAQSGSESFISIGSVVELDRLYLGGFSGSPNFVIRLNTNDVYGAPSSVLPILENSQFSLYPNPSTDLLNVDINLENTAENAIVTMFDVNGRVIEEMNFSNMKEQIVQFNVSKLNAGFYFVRIQTENGVQVKEFIKK